MEYTINEFWSDGFDKMNNDNFKVIFNITEDKIKGKIIELDRNNNDIIKNGKTSYYADFSYNNGNLDNILSIIESFYLANNDISDCKIYQFNDKKRGLSRLVLGFIINENDCVYFEIVGYTTVIVQYRNIINKILDLKDMKYNYNMYKELQNKTKEELYEELDKSDLIDAVILKRTR